MEINNIPLSLYQLKSKKENAHHQSEEHFQP